jgi:formylmethanofuran dehydrogenase subunit E
MTGKKSVSSKKSSKGKQIMRTSPKKRSVRKSPKKSPKKTRDVASIFRELKTNVYQPKSPGRKPVKKSGKRTVTCSVCGEVGHNKRYHK